MSDVILVGEVVADGARPRGPGAWLTTTDHKRIGVLYVATGLAFFLVGVGFAMLMKTQLIRPGMHLLTPEEYDQLFSMHGTTMVFLFAMPMLIGVANYIVPLQIGARDMAFPRMNALSYWLFLFGGLLLYSSFAFGGALDTGWFSYAPLSLPAYSPHDGVTFWTVSLALLGASSIMGAINFIVTMLRFRARDMGLWQMPIFSIATYLNSFLIIFAFPSLTAAIAMLYLDRHYGTVFFNPAKGGEPVIWQHLFWFFGHPEVYILILPAFGIMSEVVPVFSRKQLFGRNTMIIMLGVILGLSFLVWGHHMFTTGLPTLFNTIIAGTTMLIAIPTGVKIFNWLATMWGGSLRFKPPLLFACGLIALFTVGGITGVIQAAVPFDWQANSTYFIVGHLHNVLIAGTVFGVFAGIYYWYPKVTGRLLNDRPRHRPVLADHRGLQPHLPAHVRPRPHGHAAPRLHLRARPWLEHAQPGLVDRRLHPRDVVHPLHLQPCAQCALRRGRRRQSVASLDARVGHQPRRRHTATSAGCRRSAARVRSWDVEQEAAEARVEGDEDGRSGSSLRALAAAAGEAAGTVIGPEPEQSTIAPFFVAVRHPHHGDRPAQHPGCDRDRRAPPDPRAGGVDDRSSWAAADGGRHDRPPLLVHRRRHARLPRLGIGFLRRAHRRRHPPAHPQQQPVGGRAPARHVPGHQHAEPRHSAASPRTTPR